MVSTWSVFYGTRRFITSFTSARHLSLSWARSIQPYFPTHFLKANFNIILPSGYSKWPVFFGVFHQILYELISSSIRATFPAHLLCSGSILIISGSPSLYSLLYPVVTFSVLAPNILLWTLLLNTLSPCSFHFVREQVSHPYINRRKDKRYSVNLTCP